MATIPGMSFSIGYYTQTRIWNTADIAWQQGKAAGNGTIQGYAFS